LSENRLHHPGYPTRPLTPGAPLPEGLTELMPVQRADIVAELARAEYELMYALARHRKAWQKMRRRAKVRETLANRPGMLSHLDTDPIWKEATGDVAWWRGEMDAQASAILALRAMLEMMEGN